MDILVPIDGSECSERALQFAVELAHRFDAAVDVVHVTDHRTEATEKLLRHAEQTLEAEGIPSEPDVVFEMKKFRGSDVVGERILDIAEEDEYDHIVMGHHGTGAIGKMILGSAAETVVEGTDVPVTIIP